MLAKQEEKIETSLAAYSCCAWGQFVAKATGNLYTKQQTFEYIVYFDNVKKMGRWDQSFYDYRQNLIYSWSLYTNYNTLLEYVYVPATNTCEKTGPDAIYDWCYGKNPVMNYKGTKRCNVKTDLMCDVWTMDNGYTFSTFRNVSGTCTPYTVSHQDSKYNYFDMNFYYFSPGVNDKNIFDLPNACLGI